MDLFDILNQEDIVPQLVLIQQMGGKPTEAEIAAGILASGRTIPLVRSGVFYVRDFAILAKLYQVTHLDALDGYYIIEVKKAA